MRIDTGVLTAGFILVLVVFMVVGVFVPVLWIKIVAVVIMAAAVFGFVLLSTPRKPKSGDPGQAN